MWAVKRKYLWVTDNERVSRMYKHSQNSTKTTFLNGQNSDRHFTKEDTQVENKHMKSCSTSFLPKKTHMTTTMSYRCMLTRAMRNLFLNGQYQVLAWMQNSQNSHTSLVGIKIRQLSKAIWQLPIKLNVLFPHNSTLHFEVLTRERWKHMSTKKPKQNKKTETNKQKNPVQEFHNSFISKWQKLKTTKVPPSGQMGEETDTSIQRNFAPQWKDQAVDRYNTNDSQMFYTKWKKPDSKTYLSVSLCIWSLGKNLTNSKDREQISVTTKSSWGIRGGGGAALYPDCNGGSMTMRLPKHIELHTRKSGCYFM